MEQRWELCAYIDGHMADGDFVIREPDVLGIMLAIQTVDGLNGWADGILVDDEGALDVYPDGAWMRPGVGREGFLGLGRGHCCGCRDEASRDLLGMM